MIISELYRCRKRILPRDDCDMENLHYYIHIYRYFFRFVSFWFLREVKYFVFYVYVFVRRALTEVPFANNICYKDLQH